LAGTSVFIAPGLYSAMSGGWFDDMASLIDLM
jgi:hypothetical protein